MQPVQPVQSADDPEAKGSEGDRPDLMAAEVSFIAEEGADGLVVDRVQLAAEERLALQREAHDLLKEGRFADAFYYLRMLQEAEGWIDAELARGKERQYAGNTPTEDETLTATSAAILSAYKHVASERAGVYRAALLRYAAFGAVLTPWVTLLKGRRSLVHYLVAAEAIRGGAAGPRDFLYAGDAEYDEEASPEPLLDAIAKRHNVLYPGKAVKRGAVRKQFQTFPMPDGTGPIVEGLIKAPEFARRVLVTLEAVRAVEPSLLERSRS